MKRVPPIRTRRGEELKMAMGRQEFLARLEADFPEVVASVDRYSAGLLHCEVSRFREATERAIDAGRKWEASRHFQFIAELLSSADPELRNAVEVSYLEDLALGELTAVRYQTVKERMPAAIRTILVGHNPKWR